MYDVLHCDSTLPMQDMMSPLPTAEHTATPSGGTRYTSTKADISTTRLSKSEASRLTLLWVHTIIFVSIHTYVYPATAGPAIPTAVVPISIGALMFLVGIATFIAGVVILVRAKRVLHHSSQPPPPGTDHYEMMDEEGKRVPLGAGAYEEVDKQATQTDRHTKHYQELDMAKMEECNYATIKD